MLGDTICVTKTYQDYEDKDMHRIRRRMHRNPVNKRASLKSFRRNIGRTKVLNIKPTRGGYRL